jgi:hypothetical protein
MLTNHPTTTAALSLSLLSLFLMLAVSPQGEILTVTGETSSYTTNLASGTWIDADGNLGTDGSYNIAPFIIDEGAHKFLFSAGFVYDGITPRLGSHTADAALYHDFDHATLEPFRHLTNGRNAVLVLNESLVNAKITSMSFATTQAANGHQYIDMIYSLNDGLSWHLAPTPSGYTRDSLTINFSQSISGNRLRFGIRSRYEYSTSPYRYLSNPTLSFALQGLTATEEASALAALVEIYTPCESDIDGLTYATQAIAHNLKDQYLSLSAEAKTIFDTSEISAGNRHLDRLQFIMNKHTISINNVALSTNGGSLNKNHNDMLLAIITFGIIGYVITKRKPQ